MAGGQNQVTLTFAGDSSNLERAMGRVGSSSRTMADDVGSSSDRMGRLGDAADHSETRLLGLKDSVDGVATVMKGPGEQGIAAYIQGWADLASGVANFGVQFARQAISFVTNNAKMVASQVATVASVVAGWVLMGVQAAVNAAKMAAAWLISLGPVGLVIGAIGAVIAILVALGFGFDDLKKVAETVWNFILGVVQGFLDWLKSNWQTVLAILTGPFGLAYLAIKAWGDNIIGFITGLPSRIASAAVGMWDGITSAFKSAINALIRIWNDFKISFAGYDIPGPGPNIPGFTIDTPNIPYLHSGGMFRAPPGQREGLAMLLDGETVSRPGEGGMTVNVYVQGSILSERQLLGLVRDELKRGGFG